MFKIISISILSLLLFGCKDPLKCPTNFVIPIKLTPAKLEYKIGDTLTLTSEFNRFVQGYNSKWEALESFDMENIKWFPETFLVNIDTVNPTPVFDVINNFEFIRNTNYDYDEFIYSTGNNSLSGTFKFIEDIYSLKIQFIAKKKGIYFLSQTGQIDTPIADQDYKGRCRSDGNNRAYFEMNNRENVNFELLLESPNPLYNEKYVIKSEELFYQKGGYCFIVSE